MIHKALIFLRDQTNMYLKKVTGFDQKLTLSNLTDDSGKTIIKDLGLSLVNVEEEVIGKAQIPYRQMSDDNVYLANPPLNLNLYLLITANFGDTESAYQESLKFLSYVIRFFQAKNVFNHINTPDLDENIEKLIMELYSIPFEKQNYIWGSLGAKYLPSVMYKARIVTIMEGDIQLVLPPVKQANWTK
jgi:hypothetical protein